MGNVFQQKYKLEWCVYTSKHTLTLRLEEYEGTEWILNKNVGKLIYVLLKNEIIILWYTVRS